MLKKLFLSYRNNAYQIIVNISFILWQESVKKKNAVKCKFLSIDENGGYKL